MAKSNRDNFSDKTKRILRERVGGRCSNPSCNRETCGPSDSPDKSVILGDAAHIKAASPGGPRYDASMSVEERVHISNGIWLCTNCARLIDIDASAYPVELLLNWKDEAERKQREYLGHRIRMREEVADNKYPIYLSETPPSVVKSYIDRPQLEQKIKERILAAKHCLVTGIGGIGKTETIKSVLQEIQEQECCETGIQFLMWVTFSNNDLKESILDALPEYKILEDKNIAWNECWRGLQQYGKHLLMVIDNIEAGASDPELDHLASYPCRIVVTSRKESIDNMEAIPVSALPENDSIRLFNMYYLGEKDHFTVSEVLRLIDYHTIMIELLAKTANMEEWSVSELKRKLIDHGFRMSEEAVAGHHEKLRDENKLIQQLKILFSLTSYENAFKSMLEQVSVIPAIPFRFQDISRWTSIEKKSDLEKMVRTGWLQSDHQFKTTYIMHSVIASAIRAQFENTLYSDCRVVIRALANDMSFKADEHGSEKAWMIPFSWSVSDVLRGRLCSEDDATFLINLADIYDDIGNHEAAKEFYLRAHKIHNNMGNASEDISDDYYRLAHVCLSLDQLEEAREYGEECFKLRKESSKQNHGDILAIYGLLGPIYHKIGDVNKAEEYFCNGQEIIKNHPDIDRITALTLCADQASFYRDRGFADDFTKAEQLFENSISICSEVYPESHPETAEILENYSVLKQKKGDYAAALELTLRAQSIKKEILHMEHPDIIESYINLGYVYYLLDQYRDSMDAYDQAEKILIRCKEENTSRMAALYNNKALTVKASGDYKGALALYKKSEKIRLSYLPEDHELVLGIRNNIAHTLNEDKRFEEAAEIYEEIIAGYKRNTLSGNEVENEFHATVYNNAAEAYRGMGNYDKAYDYCIKSLSIKEVVFGKDSVDYAISLNTLAVILYYREQYDEAAKAVNKALKTYQSSLPENHHLTSAAYFNLALIEESENKDNEALEHYHKVLEIDSQLGNVDNMILTAEYIADIYQRYEMYAEEKVYRDYIEQLLAEYS